MVDVPPNPAFCVHDPKPERAVPSPATHQTPDHEARMKPGYKQTEVGVIPEDWEVVALGDVLKVKHGKNQSEVVVPDGIYPILATGGEIGKTNTPLYSSPSVLIGRKGTIDKPRYIETPFWTVDTLFYTEIHSNFCTKFVFYKIKAISWYTYNEASGVPSLNARTIEAINQAFPPSLLEQEAIAEALSDADALIEHLEQLIAKKRQVKQGAMQELLKPREGWIQQKLGDIALILRGASPRPIDSPIWFDSNSSVGWVRISDVTRSSIYLRETSQRLSALGIQHSRTVQKGSLIMSIAATVDGFVVFENLRIEKQFAYYLLKSIENDWAKHGQTGSQMNLNTNLIGRTEVHIPPLEEQTAIASILSDMDTEITALEGKLEKAQQIKHGMMHNLLTGKIRLVTPTAHATETTR
jgi:type I restriction enzyme, S subunit